MSGADRFFIDDFTRDVRYGAQIDRRADIDALVGAFRARAPFAATPGNMAATVTARMAANRALFEPPQAWMTASG